MKAKIIDGAIVKFPQIPENFENIIGLNLLSDAKQKNAGFYDYLLPDIDSNYEIWGEDYFDAEKKIFTAPIIQKEITIQEIAANKSQEFDNAKNQIIQDMMFVILPKIIRLLKKDLPPQFQGLFDALETEKTRVRNVIQGFVNSNDYEGLRKFRTKQEDVDYFKDEIKKFKE